MSAVRKFVIVQFQHGFVGIFPKSSPFLTNFFSFFLRSVSLSFGFFALSCDRRETVFIIINQHLRFFVSGSSLFLSLG